jgi:hypothetical protein
MQPKINYNKRVLYMLIGVAVLAFAGWTIYSIARRPVSGGYIRIANIREFTRGRPTNRLALAQVEHELYNKVNEYRTIRTDSVKDMSVRAGSFEQIEDDGWHRVSMIVDSESLQMSFSFFYQWGDESRFEQYGGVIFCVLPADIIFDDFECEDMSTIQTGDNSDVVQLTEILPMTTPDFSIRVNILPDPMEIIIAIPVRSDDPNSEATAGTHYQAALDWLRWQGVEVERFTREMSEQLRARGLHDSDAETAVRILQLTINSGSSLGTALNKCTGFIERYSGSPPKKLTNMLGFIQCCMADYYFKQIKDGLDASDENIKNFYDLRGFAESNMCDHDGGLPAEFMQGQISELNSQAEHIERLKR